MLNKNYFDCLYTNISSSIGAYAPLNSPLVLFSEIDGTALASIHFRPSARVGAKVSNDAKTLISMTNNSDDSIQKFQGIINKSDQEFELVISNLSPNYRIMFYLKRMENKHDQTDPTIANIINKVCIVEPFGSYPVQSDQCVDFRPLLLQACVKNNNNNDDEHNDEHDECNDKDDASAYIMLSVVPQDKEDFCARFERTIWKTSDIIVIRTDVKNNNLLNYANLTYYSNSDTTYSQSNVLLSPYENINNKITKSNKSSSDDNIDITDVVSPSKIVYGDNKVNEKWYIVDDKFNHKYKSRQGVLSLSICDLEFTTLTLNERLKWMVKDAKELCENIVKEKFSDHLTIKAYNSDECYLCFAKLLRDHNSCMLYSCGHYCVHYNCMKNVVICPYCRTHVEAKIRV